MPLHRHKGHSTFSDKHKPAEDTFLLLDALEVAVAELKGVKYTIK